MRPDRREALHREAVEAVHSVLGGAQTLRIHHEAPLVVGPGLQALLHQFAEALVLRT